MLMSVLQLVGLAVNRLVAVEETKHHREAGLGATRRHREAGLVVTRRHRKPGVGKRSGLGATSGQRAATRGRRAARQRRRRASPSPPGTCSWRPVSRPSCAVRPPAARLRRSPGPAAETTSSSPMLVPRSVLQLLYARRRPFGPLALQIVRFTQNELPSRVLACKLAFL